MNTNSISDNNNVEAEALKRVTAAAELFDSTVEVPLDWRQKIIPAQLDFTSPYYCILGMIFHDNPKNTSGYHYGRFTVFHDLYANDDYFLQRYALDLGSLNDIYINGSQLRAAWTQYLTAHPYRNLRSELVQRRAQVVQNVTAKKIEINTLQQELNALIADRDEFDLVLSVYPEVGSETTLTSTIDETNE